MNAAIRNLKKLDVSYPVTDKVKEIVHRYDNNATIILFGSRARGDWHEESDWDFLILSDLDEKNEIKERIRKDTHEEIELETFENVFVLYHNRKVWEEKYSVTPLYYNILEEGVIVA